MNLYDKINIYNQLINKFDEYLNFLNEANNGPINIAWIHGWRCSKDDIEKGENLRKEIENLKKLI